jgi:hypothetical protein
MYLSGNNGGAIMTDFLAIFILAVSVLMIFAWYRVIVKMGFPAWYFVFFLIPFLGPFLFLYLAFAEWPIERNISELRFEVRRWEMQQNMPNETDPKQPIDPTRTQSHTL